MSLLLRYYIEMFIVRASYYGNVAHGRVTPENVNNLGLIYSYVLQVNL